MNKQPIEIPRIIYIAEACNRSVLSRNNTKMLLQRLIPLFQVSFTICPCIQLLFCIIFCINCVNGMVKQLRQFSAADG